MDNGDFRGPKWDDAKVPVDKMSNAGTSRCSSPASRGLSEEDHSQSDTQSMIIRQLNDEIDINDQANGMGLETLLQSKVKPMLEKIHAEANKVVGSYNDMADGQRKTYLLHSPSLQELMLKLGFSKNMEELQSYLVSSDRMCLISENQALTMELRDAQSRHQAVVKGLHLSLHSAEQGSKSSHLSLQQSLRLGQDKVHSLEQKVKEYEGQVLYLQHNLVGANDKAHTLQKTLRASDTKLMSLIREHEESEKTVCNMHHELRALQDINQSLRVDITSWEGNAQSLRQTISEMDKRVQLFQKKHLAEEERVKSLKESLRSSEEKVTSLKQSLQTSEGMVTSLKHCNWVAEDKVHSLRQMLSTSEDKVQSANNSLKATEEKTKALMDTLGSGEERNRALQEALVVSEGRIKAATAQQQSLKQCKQDLEEKIKSLTHSLSASDKGFQSAVKDLELDLKSSRDKIALLQDTINKIESERAKEMGQLQHKLYKTIKKGATIEQDLKVQIVALNTKLLDEQSKANKELERTVVYEKEQQDTVKDLRQNLKVLSEEKDFALACLKMRQKDLGEVQRHLQVDLMKCHWHEQGKGLTALRKKDLKEEFTNLRTNLHSVLESDGVREGVKGCELAQVLEKTKEWENVAEKLVNSLYSHQQRPKERVKETDQYRTAPQTMWRSGSRSPSAVLPLQSTLSNQPLSQYINGQSSGQEGVETSSPNRLKDTECMRHLLSVQKRLKNLHSMDFQRNIKGLMRPS